MPHLLFNLRHVPHDEAAEIRALFEANNIDFYETEPNRWGISAGGFWTHDEAAVERARHLLGSYQSERAARAREAWSQAQRNGDVPSLWQVFYQEPLRIGLALVGVLAILALTILLPYWLLSR
jgi:hypothetical protein